MTDIILVIFLVIALAFWMSISVQLARIERLLKVIAVKASGDSFAEVTNTIKRMQR